VANPALLARVAAQIWWPGAVVVERGRGHIKHRHPTDPNRFMFDAQVGGRWHYGPALDQEVDTDWVAGGAPAPFNYRMEKAGFNAYLQSRLDAAFVGRYTDPATGEYVELDPQNLQWTNDLSQIQFISVPDAIDAVVSGDKATWPNGYGTGRHFSWEAQTARLEKLLTIDSLASLPTANATIRSGGNPSLELQLTFRRSSGVGIWVNGTRWDTGSHADRATSGLVEFRLITTGQVLWWFNLPRSWDSAGQQVLGAFWFKRSGQSLNVFHRVPLAWIEDAARVWPLMVDTTVDEQVGAGADDCYIWSTTGFDKTDTATYFGRWNSTYNKQENASRFTTVAISNGAAITSNTYLSFYSSGNFSNTVPVLIYGEDADNPGAIADRTDYDSRALTTASVAWTPGNFSADTWYNTPGIATCIQEIVDRVGFAENNAMGFFCGDRAGSIVSDSSNRGVRTYDHNTTLAPKLHVEFTAGGGGGKPWYAYAQQ